MRSRAFFMSLVVLLGGAPMSPGSLTASDVPGSWTWQPRAESITIERLENETPQGGVPACAFGARSIPAGTTSPPTAARLPPAHSIAFRSACEWTGSVRVRRGRT